MRLVTSKKLTKDAWIALLVLVLLGQTLLIAALYVSRHNFYQRYPIDQERLQSQIISAQGAALETHVTVSPTDNAVYLPELHIKLPLTPASLQLLYSLRTDPKAGNAMPDEADISTVQLSAYAPPKMQAIGCSNAVRIKFEATPNPYNPHETATASVKLADGRTLQVYAFHHDSCNTAFQVSGTDTDAVAALFKDVKSY
jgi:hypothetical protein